MRRLTKQTERVSACALAQSQRLSTAGSYQAPIHTSDPVGRLQAGAENKTQRSRKIGVLYPTWTISRALSGTSYRVKSNIPPTFQDRLKRVKDTTRLIADEDECEAIRPPTRTIDVDLVYPFFGRGPGIDGLSLLETSPLQAPQPTPFEHI